MNFGRICEGSPPLVMPVIHVLGVEQTCANLRLVQDAGCAGAFLINHDFGVAPFLPILGEVRAACPDMWLGVNFLGQPGSFAFPVLAQLQRDGTAIQAYWADDARVDERQAEHGPATPQIEAMEIARIRQQSGWAGAYFGGVAFKKQRPVARADYARAASLAAGVMDVVTTSGPATGQTADPEKTRTFRAALGSAPLALASGITPENAGDYADHVDVFMVATGINRPGDFYTIEAARLEALMRAVQGKGASR